VHAVTGRPTRSLAHRRVWSSVAESPWQRQSPITGRTEHVPVPR